MRAHGTREPALVSDAHALSRLGWTTSTFAWEISGRPPSAASWCVHASVPNARARARSQTRASQPIHATPIKPCLHPEQVPFTSQMLADNMHIVSVPQGFKDADGDEDAEGGAGFDWGLLHRNILQPFAAETW